MRKLLHIVFGLIVAITTAQNKTIDSLIIALQTAKNDSLKCNLLYLITENSSDEEKLKYNDELNKLSTANLKIKSNSNYYKNYYAFALTNYGVLASVKGDFIKALEQLNTALKIYQEINNKKGIVNTLNEIGLVYKNKGEIDKALSYYQRSLVLQNEIDDKETMSTILNNIGTIFKFKGDIPKAIDYFDKSLKLEEEIGNKSGIAILLNNIGNLYQELGNSNKAIEFLNKSLKLREEIGDKSSIAQALNNIGKIYYNTSDLKKAVEYFDKSLKLLEAVENYQGIAYVLINYGLVYMKTNELDKAKDNFNRSLTLMEKIGSKQGIAICLNNIGSINLLQGDHKSSLANTLRSMAISKELGTPELIKNASNTLFKLYLKNGNHKLALENYQLYVQMRDSLNNIENQKATIKQQTKYEYDKKKAIEDEKHAAELKVQEEKAQADKNKQNIIIGSVSLVLILVAIFSILLFNRFKTTQKQKLVIEQKEKETQIQKYIIEEKQKEILDSINYAKRIQYTLLAHADFLKENIPNNFIYFNPKDIVSGDFYWAAKKENRFYLAVCDSTGHGVPGAFMSLLNIGFLSEAINEKGIEKPNEVFNFVRQRLIDNISKEGQKDGFDGILICMDQHSKQITYAAANNNPILIQNGKLIELEADRMPVGMGERKEDFKSYSLNAGSGDSLYLYTDGYADQFGGEKGKKFKYKQLNELLHSNYSRSLDEQLLNLKQTFEGWQGKLEQVDDVCLIGIRL